MGVEEHREAAGDTPVTFHVIVVSTSRTQHDDRSGPLIQRLLEQAGHRVLGRDLLPDDQATVRGRLESLRDGGEVQAVITSGGTGLSVRDRTYEAVQQILDKELPGFGELFRRLSYDEIGSAAMMSRATCGLAGTMAVFALPGSPNACRLALEALVLPEIHHVLYERHKEGPAPSLPAPAAPTAAAFSDEPEQDEAPEGEPQRGVKVEVLEKSEAEEAPPEPAATDGAGWQAALAAMDPDWKRSDCPPLPASIEGNAALENVLQGAGQRGSATIEGTVFGLYGFPDLLRPSSKVLMVGDVEPNGCLVALHRHPRRVGVLAKWGQALPGWPNTGNDPARVGSEITGRAYSEQGSLFAIEGDRIFVLDGQRVRSWDGRRARVEGGWRSALASLALRWSQR